MTVSPGPTSRNWRSVPHLCPPLRCSAKRFAAYLSLCMLTQGLMQAQGPSTASPGAPAAQRMADIEQRLRETQETLEKSLQEIQRLRAELDALRAQPVGAQAGATAAETSSSPNAVDPVSVQDDLHSLHDEQDALQAEIRQHEQTKVETASKYPLRVSGLVLFNAFSNAGVVDNAELPSLALPRFPGASHGSLGSTLRQTVLEIEAVGPSFAGAQSHAEVSVDFFGGTSSNALGYSASAGVVRMRKALAALSWPRTTAEAGYTGPLISPLSPTSYATVAQPSLSASGNLWTWAPQFRIEQRFPLTEGTGLTLEGGFIFPDSPGYTSIQLDSPVEASRRPGYEGRLSYRSDRGARTGASPFAIGVGGYSATQFYNRTTQVSSWAVTSDWQIPLLKSLQLSGEAYRGSALGGLGGGAYKDVLTGTDPLSGLDRTVGVDVVGGWSQLKLRPSPALEANAVFGLDDALAANFEDLVLPAGANPLELYARNRSIVANLIFRPRTYLVFSPEYRRLTSWRYSGPANIANIFTLSAAYQF